MSKFCLTLSSIAALACLTQTGFAQQYSVKDIGALSEKKMSSPAAITNNNQIAGTSFSGSNDDAAFRYVSEKDYIEVLDQTSSGSVSHARGINETGAVVGDSTFGGAAYGPSPYFHAALFMNGSAYDLGSLRSGEFSSAKSINDAGQVVGFSGPNANGDYARAFLWTQKLGMQDIGTLGGDNAQASAINASGGITGNAQIYLKNGPAHAFFFQSDAGVDAPSYPMMDLGTLGGDSSYGTAINASNHIAGYSTLADGRFHAFLVSGGKMLDLGSLGAKDIQADQSVALGLNSSDQVVGYSYLPRSGASFTTSAPIVAPQPAAFV
ncbi:MAG: hypothetical protein ACR2NX_13110 [Chthoniobacterales bacterium]